MRSVLFSIIVLLAASSQAATDTFSNACFWKGEENIKKSVIEDKLMWLEAVYLAHETGGDTPAAFEGIGSCRFVPRTLGETSEDVIKNHIEKGYVITATRAYLKIEGGVKKVVIPSATYAAGTNYLFVKKDFYSMNNVELCMDQQKQVETIGKAAKDLGLTDIQFSGNDYGVTAIINGDSPEANLFGICNFHSL